MTILIVDPPKTSKGKIFAEMVKEHATEIVAGPHYIEQRFFGNSEQVGLFYGRMREKFRKPMAPFVGYFPEVVNTWVDGVTTITGNEHFLNRYQTLEALEGLAKHALCHADYQMQNLKYVPFVELTHPLKVDLSFPVTCLNMDEKIKLWQECERMEEEAAVVRRAIDIDPYSAMAEDCEIDNIILGDISKGLKRTLVKYDPKKTPPISRKSFAFLLTNFHIGKDAAFLMSENRTIKDYKARHYQDVLEKERKTTSEALEEAPEAREFVESFNAKSEFWRREYTDLMKDINPRSREDFARFITAFLSKGD